MSSYYKKTSNPFVANGALPPDSPIYIDREADQALYQASQAGQLCYVFAPHDMGKSSLASRTAWKLTQEGSHAAIITLSGLDESTSNEHLYLWFVKRLKAQLNFTTDPTTWFTQQTTPDLAERLKRLFKEVILTELSGPIVIFIDELNIRIKDITFVKDLLMVIESLYRERDSSPALHRLTFVLLGVMTPDALPEKLKRFIVTSGQSITVDEFSRPDTQKLEQRLESVHPDKGAAIFDRIYYWTHGHPYLTQRLCQAVTDISDVHWDDERVDNTMQVLFLSSASQGNDPNIQAATQLIASSPKQRQLLNLYQRVLANDKIAEDNNSPVQNHLKISGIVASENGSLHVRNKIYEAIFNQEWLTAQQPTNWNRHLIITLVLLAIVAIGATGFYTYQQHQKAIAAQELVDNFHTASGPEQEIASLAGLFNLSGHESKAHELFFQELSPEEQLSLFDLSSPETVGEELVAVVRHIYQDDRLVNNSQNNGLLRAMTQPLNRLEYDPALRSVELELEINQWLRGREIYLNQGELSQAIQAYDTAIRINTDNPGLYFDRALAYAGQEKADQALADFATALSIDDTWQGSIQQTIQDNPNLYETLWANSGAYHSLTAMVPTPTSTPTQTSTPTITPSPTATFTPSPTLTPTLPPTNTPLPIPVKPTDTATAVRQIIAATATPSIPTGQFTLISPLSLNDPTYGTTTFEWTWTGGDLPQDYGFEVRVWRDGSFQAGVHNAVLDNQNGTIKKVGENRYQLTTDITDAAGVERQSGVYNWTVAVVKISPDYKDIGQHADPVQMRYAAPGPKGGGGGGKDGGGGGKSVGID
ncbi:MAG: AAA-like domain-containing protein [Anaerolineae bacterium]|nr:AAA-like domain-containing protein [Anaerolineae bacterium]